MPAAHRLRLVPVALSALLILVLSAPASAQTPVAATPEPAAFQLVDDTGDPQAAITVTEVADPFEGFDTNAGPAAENRFVALTVATRNTGAGVYELRPNDFKLQDSTGMLWNSRSVRLQEGATVPVLQTVQLAPGDRITGLVTFELPLEAAIAALHLQPENTRLITVANAIGDTAASAPSPGSTVTVSDTETATEGVFTVTEIADPFEGYAPNRAPDAGSRYVLVTLTVENTGTGQLDVAPSSMLIRDANGYLWRYASIPREDDSAIPDLQSQTLAPGSRITGTVGFAIPTDAAVSDVLYQPVSGRLITLAALPDRPGS